MVRFFLLLMAFSFRSIAYAKAGLGEAPFAAQLFFFSPVLLLGIAAAWLLLLSIWYSTQTIISPSKSRKKKLFYSGAIQACFWCALLALTGPSGALSLFANIGNINYYWTLPASTVIFLFGVMRYWTKDMDCKSNNCT